MAEPSKEISDEALIRVLAEYTNKADEIYQTYVRMLVYALGFLGFGVMSIASGIHLIHVYLSPSALSLLAIAITLALLLSYPFFATLMRRSNVERATWQLRRIYQLVSTRENLGVRLDSGTRLELELRLSDAGFILTQMKRFDRPEKFAPFRRVGPESPFRVLEPDDSLLRFADPPAPPAPSPDAPNHSTNPA